MNYSTIDYNSQGWRVAAAQRAIKELINQARRINAANPPPWGGSRPD
jgi:hypothetical protein